VKDAVKLVAVVAAALLLGWAFTSARAGKGYALKPGVSAPNFELPTLAGERVSLANLRGRIVVVNFWATWCPPCVDEMPSLERLHRALGREGLVVLGVSADEDEAALRAFVAKAGITFPILRDPGGRSAAALYRTTGYPETFVVDAKGVLHESFVGPAEWSSPGAIDHFRDLLRSASTAPTR
jgi:peroxiredoxin